MATPELLQLLDSVLAGEIPEIPVFEQRVGRISAIIRSMEPREVKSVQSLIQQGSQEGKYDRGNSELVLMYLQSAIRGSSASLRLHTKKGRRRREEGETGNAPAQADPNLRLLDTEPDEVLKVPDETKAFLQPFWSGKEPRRSVHHSISPRAKSRDFGALRTLTSELQRLRGKTIGWTFRRLLGNLWEVRTVETEEMRKTKQRREACKRLINHFRKALIYPKSEAISLWKLRKEGESIGEPHKYVLLKRLFTISKTSFYIRKQRFFALWKAKSKPPLPIQSISPVKRATPKSLKRKRATKSSQQTLSVSSAEVKETPGASAEALELWKRLTMGRWKDTRSPGSALATALLRRADKTLKIALNRVMSVNRLSNIQQFGYALARLDQFIAPTDIALKAAYLTWNRAVPRVRKERIRSTLRLALRVYKRLLRLRILTWKAYIQAQATYYRDLTVLRLIGTLTKVLRNRAQNCLFSPSSGAETDRTHRSGSRLTFGKSEGNKKALRTIIRGFAGGLKEALHLWYIENVTRRCGKEAGKLAAMVTFIAGRRGDRLGAAFRAISYKADSVSAELQADFISKVKKPLLETVLKTAKNQLKSTFSDIKSIQQLFSLQKTAIGRTLLRVSELKTLKALRLWQTHCLSQQLHSHVSQSQVELENARKLQKRLLLIWRKQLRTVLSRVIRSDKDRLSLGVKTLAVAMQRRQKGAIEAVHEAGNQVKGVDMRFEKMKKVLEMAGLRSIRPIFTHIIRPNASLKLILRSLSKTFGRTAQSALYLWQESAQRIALMQTHTALSFQSKLHQIATKTLRKGFTSLQTDGHRVKSALRALYLTIERSREVAWKQWKMGMVVKAGEGLEQQVKAGKMNKTLERIARKPLRSGLPRAALPLNKAEISHKFQSALSRLPLKPMRNAYNRIVTGWELLRKSLQLLFLLFNARPREALCRWKEALYAKSGKEGISKGEIMNKVLRNSVLMHLRAVYRQLIEKPSRYLAAIRTIMRITSRKPKDYLRNWRLQTGLKPSFSDNTQKLRLARAGELLIILKKRPVAVIRMWQEKTRSFGTVNVRKSAIRTLIKAWGKQIHTLLWTWRSKGGNKDSEKVIKGAKLRLFMQNVALKRLKTGVKQLFPSSEVRNSPILSLISGLSGPLHRVFVSLRRTAVSKSKPDKQSIHLALIVLQRNHNSACSLFFSYWKRDQKRLAKRFSQRLSLLTSIRKAITLQAIAALGPLYHFSARIQAAQKLLTLSRRTDIYLLRPPLRLWADIAGERTKRLRLKGVISFIYNTPIGYQSGFWRWGLVREHGEVIFPHQLSFLKNVAKVLHRVQRNRVSTSFTLLSCNRPSSPAPPRSISPFSLHHRSTSDSRRSSTSLNTEEGEYANASTIHTIVNNKLTAQEMGVVRQMGAMETLGLVLRTAFVRNKVAAFVSIRDEAELNEMKECNDLLMGDMANLQEGNKQIMDAFKESTINLEALSRKLDVMRTERVVKVLDKVRMVLPAYEAFLMIKLHAGFSLI